MGLGERPVRILQATSIRATGVPAMAVSFDVGDLVAVRTANQAITVTLGAATILVNNAGGGRYTPLANVLGRRPLGLGEVLPHQHVWRDELLPHPHSEYG
jgi:NAD(P)-dependent dehydrogenase (short-subunit alcohol dehydrogenase family)